MGNTPIEEWTKSPLLRKIRSPNQNKHVIKEQSNNQTDNLSHTNTVTFFHLIWVENKKEESSQLRLKQKNPISWKPDNWEKWDPLDFCDLKMMWKTPMPDFNWWIFFFFFLLFTWAIWLSGRHFCCFYWWFFFLLTIFLFIINTWKLLSMF